MENRRVLVVDDDLDLLESYRQILGARPVRYGEALRNLRGTGTPPQRPPFELDTAINGEQAIQKVANAIAENRPYAVALIDLHMPPGKDGVETLRQIRKLDAQLIAVLITAYSDSTIDEMQRAGEHDVQLAHKPLGQDELYQLTRNGCNSWQRAAQLRYSGQQLQQQNRQLQRNSRLMEQLLVHMGQGAACYDSNGRIHAVNPVLQQQLQRPIRVLLGMRVKKLELLLQQQQLGYQRLELESDSAVGTEMGPAVDTEIDPDSTSTPALSPLRGAMSGGLLLTTVDRE